MCVYVCVHPGGSMLPAPVTCMCARGCVLLVSSVSLWGCPMSPALLRLVGGTGMPRCPQGGVCELGATGLQVLVAVRRKTLRGWMDWGSAERWDPKPCTPHPPIPLPHPGGLPSPP